MFDFCIQYIFSFTWTDTCNLMPARQQWHHKCSGKKMWAFITSNIFLHYEQIFWNIHLWTCKVQLQHTLYLIRINIIHVPYSWLVIFTNACKYQSGHKILVQCVQASTVPDLPSLFKLSTSSLKQCGKNSSKIICEIFMMLSVCEGYTAQNGRISGEWWNGKDFKGGHFGLMTVLVWHMPEWNDENQEGSQSGNVMAKKWSGPLLDVSLEHFPTQTT